MSEAGKAEEAEDQEVNPSILPLYMEAWERYWDVYLQVAGHLKSHEAPSERRVHNCGVSAGYRALDKFFKLQGMARPPKKDRLFANTRTQVQLLKGIQL